MEHFFEKIDGWSQYSEQGELLELILSIINVKSTINIAEIGVYMGRCTAMWNIILTKRNIPYTYEAIDTFTGSKEHDKNIDYYNITKNNLTPIQGKVNIIKNDSLAQVKVYPDNFFDIVYIDASHEYQHVKDDILNWLPKVKTGGIICGDDYINGWADVIRAVDETFNHRVQKFSTQQWWVKV